MATKSAATVKHAQAERNGKGLEINHNVMDEGASEALFRAMSILSLGIEATLDKSLNRTFLHWPNTAEAVWDILDEVMVRAGLSDGTERPWVNAAEMEAAQMARPSWSGQ
jgi:hypothetical protein